MLITFTAYVLTHWTICRSTQWRPHARVINVLWLCFQPVYVSLFFVLGGELRTPLGVVDGLNGLLLDGLLLLGYTYFFFLVERGLSLRVMIEISRAPQSKMTIQDIMRVYPYDYIIDKRIGQMVKMGYAKVEGDRIAGTSKSARLAAANKLVRKILRLEPLMP